jgi:hypothetical protein
MSSRNRDGRYGSRPGCSEQSSSVLVKMGVLVVVLMLVVVHLRPDGRRRRR